MVEMSTPWAASIGSTIGCQAAEPSRIVLPSIPLMSVRALALAEGEAEGVERAHVEHGLERHPVLDGEGEDAGAREAHVGLAHVHELDRRRAVRRPGLHLDVERSSK
jgi:hypothetical protein